MLSCAGVVNVSSLAGRDYQLIASIAKYGDVTHQALYVEGYTLPYRNLRLIS